MDIEEFRVYCLSFPFTEECTPFDESTLVFKVSGKMFAFVATESFPLTVNLKCDPEFALELRERHPDDIFPGYHMSKVHWNTVVIEGNLPRRMICDLIRHSYDRVVAKMLKKDRDKILGSLPDIT